MTSRPDAALAARAVRRLGSRSALADFLGVGRPVVDAVLDGTGVLPPSAAAKINGLLLVTERLQRVAPSRVPAGWLRTPCERLDGAAPEDVLAVEGPARVLAAIDDQFG